MSCTPLPKAAKPVWAKQLTRLPCLVVYVKFQFGYTTKRPFMLKQNTVLGSLWYVLNVPLVNDKQQKIGQCGRGEDNAYPKALNEWLLRTLI